MSFIVDKQTLEDLNLLGKYKSNSIYHAFDKTATRGGEQVMEEMFRHPLTDAAEINRRSSIFQSFMEKPCDFPFTSAQIDSVEYYMSTPAYANRGVNMLRMFYRKAMIYIAANRMYELLVEGLANMVELFMVLRDFCNELKGDHPAYVPVCEEVEQILASPAFAWMKQARGQTFFTFWQLERYHYLLHVEGNTQLERLFRIIYELDVYIAVAKVANERRFTCAHAETAKDESSHRINLAQVFHPSVRGAKANSVCIDSEKNVLFLTGANMAGKSTFMKSFGVAVYLAHMGFPVPAERMEFTVRDGLYTSINVSDNMSKGYSHFYAEVKRVKFIAEEVATHKNLVVIFDELFKGTNVKDAYDATVAVVKAFSGHHNCAYIISTHILEAGQTLMKECDNFKFVYFPTIMDGSVPRYTYQLTEGITGDRHGMMIIRNEKIIDIIRGNK
ncbi:DNA mismatch repair protein MutS domain-containing protein [gut metagenome]|uniref:DNA mismatch repair protein MutS domain-containing protein n=1 Tax=gut metagenome TaxID=749906 RepID=J9FTF4_9ZZZZ